MSYLSTPRNDNYLAPSMEIGIFSREDSVLLCTSPGGTIDENSWGPDYSEGMV